MGGRRVTGRLAETASILEYGRGLLRSRLTASTGSEDSYKGQVDSILVVA